jgi:predicted  nucleic acid-binding Zn-ribbon protein
MSEVTNDRNIRALAEAAKQERARVDALHTAIAALTADNRSLRSEVQALRQEVIMQRMKTSGSGSTSHG